MIFKLLSNVHKVAMYSLVGYFIYGISAGILGTHSVAGMNIVLGIITVLIGSALAISGVMANDSGKGGVFTITFQYLALSYPLVYLIGLVSSIWVLYSDLENKKVIAFWLASLAGFHLLVIVVLLGVAYSIEEYKRKQEEKRYERYDKE